MPSSSSPALPRVLIVIAILVIAAVVWARRDSPTDPDGIDRAARAPADASGQTDLDVRGAPLMRAPATRIDDAPGSGGARTGGSGDDTDPAEATDSADGADGADGALASDRGETSPAPAPQGPVNRAPMGFLPLHSLELVRRLEEGAASDAGELTHALASDGVHLRVPFAVLAGFPYETPRADDFEDGELTYERLPDQIPQPIRDLDGKPVMLVGYMVPIEFDMNGEIASFILTQNQSFCCFGIVPAMNEWVTVTLSGNRKVRYFANEPIGVLGTLSVGERIEDGWITSVYRASAESVLTPSDLKKEADRVDR